MELNENANLERIVVPVSLKLKTALEALAKEDDIALTTMCRNMFSKAAGMPQPARQVKATGASKDKAAYNKIRNAKRIAERNELRAAYAALADEDEEE